MKYLKIFETFSTQEKIKDKINLILSEINVDLDNYSYIINIDDVKHAATNLVEFMFKILHLDEEKYEICYTEIKSILNDLEIDDEFDDLNQYSVLDIIDEIYNYMDEYSNYELDNEFEYLQDIENFNL